MSAWAVFEVMAVVPWYGSGNEPWVEDVAEEEVQYHCPYSTIQQVTCNNVKGRFPLEKFVDDDSGYEKWIESHPDGYVLNAERGTLSTCLMNLHRARCYTIVPRSDRRWTHQYIKVCSTDMDEIVAWVRTKYCEEPKRCKICNP